MTECDHNYYKSKGGNYYWWLSYYSSIGNTTCKFECQDQYVIWDSKCTSFCYGTATDQEASHHEAIQVQGLCLCFHPGRVQTCDVVLQYNICIL